MKKNKKKLILAQIKKNLILYLLLVPLIVWYVAFLDDPMYGMQITLKKILSFSHVLESKN